MGPYCWRDPRTTLPRKPTIYRIYGIVVHQGGRAGGHYVSYVKEKGAWKHISDSNVRDCPSVEVMHSQAYMLFYQRDNPEPTPEDSGAGEDREGPQGLGGLEQGTVDTMRIGKVVGDGGSEGGDSEGRCTDCTSPTSSIGTSAPEEPAAAPGIVPPPPQESSGPTPSDSRNYLVSEDCFDPGELEEGRKGGGWRASPP
ncbi:unnamed protein product [Discosporangium mesarthrocarpum]